MKHDLEMTMKRWCSSTDSWDQTKYVI